MAIWGPDTHNCNYVFTLHYFQDIIAYFLKFKHDCHYAHLRNIFIKMLTCHKSNLYRKFEVSSFSHSRDIIGA